MDETLEITRAGLAEHLTTELRDKHPDIHFDTESSDQWSVRVFHKDTWNHITFTLYGTFIDINYLKALGAALMSLEAPYQYGDVVFSSKQQAIEAGTFIPLEISVARDKNVRWLCPYGGHPLELISGSYENRLWKCPVDGFAMHDSQLVDIQSKITPGWIDPEIALRKREQEWARLEKVRITALGIVGNDAKMREAVELTCTLMEREIERR